MQIAGLTLPDAMIDSLRSAYATPPRAYHHFGHVEEVLIHHGEVASGPGWTQPIETALAVLYHDAVYVAGARDNEVRSAVLARQHIAHWLPQSAADAGRVAELIELTARHGQLAPADFGAGGVADDTRHFLDCDMAILGAPSEAFDRYDSAIAEEYRGVIPAWLYRRKRRAFLRSLLERERIFLSDFFHARLDGAARANLARAIARKPAAGARD
jgi:predicted metal-dependent HD superfamily phosphohydrolase